LLPLRKQVAHTVQHQLLSAICCLSISGCVTVSLGEHDVSPDVQTDLKTPFSAIRVSTRETGYDTTHLKEALDDEGIEAEFADGSGCFDRSASEVKEAVTLDQLLTAESRIKAARCDIHLVIVVGQNDNTNETDLAASIINYRNPEYSETIRIHAEGNVRGFSPMPVPYLSLLYFRSTPDTIGSAREVLAEAIAARIEAEISERPVRLLYLKSDNLPLVARNIAQQAKPEGAPELPGDVDEDSEISIYNPLRGYILINREAAEEGNPMIQNPIGQLFYLLASITATPFVIIFDIIDPPETATEAESSALTHASEAINRQNWEATYRHLEDCIEAQNNEVRERCRYLLQSDPGIIVAAKQTFSEAALQESKNMYGDAALNIEQQRFAIYESITTKDNIAWASRNMLSIFRGYQHISDRRLRKEAGVYCPNADLGHADARKRIAELYLYGNYSVNKDLVQAYVWYHLATKSGNDEALRQLDTITGIMTAEQLAEAQRLLEQWQPGQCERDLLRNSFGMAQDTGKNTTPAH